MSVRSFLVLAIVTLVMVAAAGWSVWSEQAAHASPSDEAAIMFPALADPEGGIAEVDIQTAGYMLALQHQDGTWVAADRGDYPVRADLVDDLIAAIAGLRPVAAKTSDPTLYPRIGVEDVTASGATSKLVRLLDAEGNPDAAVLIGQRSTSIGADPAGGVFVRRPDEAQSWLAEGAVNVPGTIGDWFDEVVHIPATEVQRITVSEAGAVVFDAEKRAGEAKYTLLSVAPAYGGDGYIADDARTKQIAEGIISVSPTDVRPLAEVTFPADGRTVRFQTANGMTLDAKLGEAGGQTLVAYHAEAMPGTDAARTAEAINSLAANWAFQVDSSKIAALTPAIADLVQSPEEQEQQQNALVPDLSGLGIPGLQGGQPGAAPFGGAPIPQGLPTTGQP